MEYHDRNSYLGINLPDELRWTPQGTVDKKKTAEALIKDESLDITRRYKLACITVWRVILRCYGTKCLKIGENLSIVKKAQEV